MQFVVNAPGFSEEKFTVKKLLRKGTIKLKYPVALPDEQPVGMYVRHYFAISYWD